MAQLPNNWILDNDAAISALHQILLFNGRALLLLLCCFILLRFFKVSASSRHFLMAMTIASMVLIPLFSKWIPAIDIIIDADQPVLLEALRNNSILTPTMGVGLNHPEASSHYAILFLLAYILVCMVLVLRVVLGNLKMLLLLKLSLPLTQSYWGNALRQHSRALGIKRKITIVHSPLIRSPSTWGALRPIIFIPSNATQWPDHLITSTLLHELAHIKRFDWLVQQLAKCVCAVYWINPFCWRAFQSLSSNAETACDDAAIVAGLHKTRYANDLLHVAEHVQQHISYHYAALNMAAENQAGQLSDRVLTILNPMARHTPMSKRNAFIIFFATICLLLPFASLRANFIERVHIVVPATIIKNGVATERGTLNKPYATTPSNITVALNLTTKNADPIRAGRPEFIIKPRIVTQLQTISTREIIDKLTKKYLKQSSPNTINRAQTYTKPLVVKSLKIQQSKVKKEQKIIETHFVTTPNSPEIQIRERAVALHLVVPKYPRRALSRGIEGEVTVEYSLDKFGKVINARIVSIGNSKVFNRTALKAIKNSVFSPSTLNGQPVAAMGLYEKYVFVLES